MVDIAVCALSRSVVAYVAKRVMTLKDFAGAYAEATGLSEKAPSTVKRWQDEGRKVCDSNQFLARAVNEASDDEVRELVEVWLRVGPHSYDESKARAQRSGWRR